jgi:hypothetical protein
MESTDADKIVRIRRIIDDLDKSIEEAGMRDNLFPTLLSIRNQIGAVLGYSPLTRDSAGNVRRE